MKDNLILSIEDFVDISKYWNKGLKPKSQCIC